MQEKQSTYSSFFFIDTWQRWRKWDPKDTAFYFPDARFKVWHVEMRDEPTLSHAEDYLEAAMPDIRSPTFRDQEFIEVTPLEPYEKFLAALAEEERELLSDWTVGSEGGEESGCSRHAFAVNRN